MLRNFGNCIIERFSFTYRSWFFGDIPREDAEEILEESSIKHGSFLIRNTGKKPGEYSLSLRNMEEVNHFKINRRKKGFYLEPNITFKTIPELVAHYNGQVFPIKLKSICLLEPPDADNLPIESSDAWEMRKKFIYLIRRINIGTFSEVWEGRWNKDDTMLAVKMLKPGAMSVYMFLKEAELLKELSHPRVIQLCAVCTQEEPIYIITELMKHGSLLEYLRGDGRSLELPQLINMGAQVAAGMAYLEEKNCIHQNLAAKNILVGENLTCKVAGFSSAHVISKEAYEVPAGTKFSIKWTAMEAALHNYFTTKCDVWSFGILLYEIITYGSSPYPGMTDAEVIEALQTGYRMPCPDDCPEQLYDIMKECWRDEATSRPTFKTVQDRMKLWTKTEPTSLDSDQVRYKIYVINKQTVHRCLITA